MGSGVTSTAMEIFNGNNTIVTTSTISSFSTIGHNGASSFTITIPSSGTNWGVLVAVDTDGVEHYSNVISFSAAGGGGGGPAVTDTGAPGLLTASTTNATSITFTLGSAASGLPFTFDHYLLVYAPGTLDPSGVIDAQNSVMLTGADIAALGSINYGGASTITVSGLTAGTAYSFIISASDADTTNISLDLVTATQVTTASEAVATPEFSTWVYGFTIAAAGSWLLMKRKAATA